MPCARAFWISIQHVVQTVYIFCLALDSAALWVGNNAASPPISYLICLSVLIYPHWFYFSFISCSLTPWIFDFSGLTAVSDMDSLSRDPLLRVPLMVFVRRFLEEALKFPSNLMSPSMQSSGVTLTNLLGGLHSCFRVLIF